MLPLLVHLAVVSIKAEVIDLTGSWSFYSSKGQFYKGNVPGDVFTDLFKEGVIPHPLYGDNSLHLGWISRERWTYNRTISLSKEQLKDINPVLIFEGIDTVSRVYLNNKLLLKTDNQFRGFSVDVKEFLKEENVLEVAFDSPVDYSEIKSQKYKLKTGHELPPDCPPGVYHGECHPNFIRKAQYSYSWDWGPSIPTVGIWKPVRLLLAKRATPLKISWITEKSGSNWKILGSISYWNVPAGGVECSVSVGQIANTSVALSGKGHLKIREQKFTLEIPESSVELWWPTTKGLPRLYNLTLTCGGVFIREEIGFRTVELIQDLVDEKSPEKGRNFYFKINQKPIFLKGSNWIPASMFPGEDVENRVDFLLSSAIEANMNVLRVWGGGVYESEEFYRLANRKGLLLWQDMMFACALYPTDKRFLTTVAEEVEEQIFRLRKHPSVLLFAGNNENEVAIRGHWWTVQNYTEEEQVRDYVALYADTIAPIVREMDPSRPFLLSSPSNGLMTEKEGGVAKNPGDVRYGDIHFYNEFIDLWQDWVYLTPRCATEYGVQSMPFRNTMIKWMNESDWEYAGKTLTHRQHHPGGWFTNLMVVFEHFPVPFGCSKQNIHRCDSPRFIDRFAYFSQAHQALAYKVQTEHYRRFRGKLLPDGTGNTMCALYWQLNDVWAAPTWSSVDFNLQWKMAHYESRRFFSPLILVLYSTISDSLALSVMNDREEEVKEAQLTVLQFGWGSAFGPAFKDERTIAIPAAGSLDVLFDSKSADFFGETSIRDYDSDYIFSAQLSDSKGNLLAPVAVLLPDKLYESPIHLSGDLSIENFQKIDNLTYSFTLVATDISPLTWLSLTSSDFLFWFSDNGFTQVSPRKEIKLYLWKETRLVKQQMITVCNIKTCLGSSIN